MLKCPKCGYMFKVHTSASGTKPYPPEGGIMVCINCGAVLQYCRKKLIELTDEEYDKLPSDTLHRMRGQS